MDCAFVFNLAFNKCGTTSLAKALNILGVPTLDHWFLANTRNGPARIRLIDVARRNIALGRRPFQGVDEKYWWYTDFFGQAFYREIDTAYPDSKFILTVRPIEDWLRSREQHVYRNRANPNYRGGLTKVDIDGWRRHFISSYRYIKQYFSRRPDVLLIIDVPGGDGWDELCPFLGCDIPDSPFPKLNRTETYNKPTD
jgi:hypothetical protein